MSPTSSLAWVERALSPKFLELNPLRSPSGSSEITSLVRALCISSWRVRTYSRMDVARARRFLSANEVMTIGPPFKRQFNLSSSPPASAGIPQAVMRCAAPVPIVSGRVLRSFVSWLVFMGSSLFFLPRAGCTWLSVNNGRARTGG